jgi:hypothetical protein
VRSLDILVGIWWLLFDRRHRRLGDFLAGTLVVCEDARRSRLVPGRLPASWGGEPVAITEELVARLDELAPESRRDLSRQLIRLLARDAPELFPDGVGGEPEGKLRRVLEVREEKG